MPGCVVWVIGVPLIVWSLLKDRKQQLENEEVKSKFGFLYNGYKPSNYFWESVIMLRKVSIIFIAVFLQGEGSRIQAFVVFMLVVCFTVLTSRRKPYLSRRVNDLEVFSLLSSGITLYAGFFFLSELSAGSPAYDSTKDCKLSHLSLAGSIGALVPLPLDCAIEYRVHACVVMDSVRGVTGKLRRTNASSVHLYLSVLPSVAPPLRVAAGEEKSTQ